MKKKPIRSAVIGLLALLGSAFAFVLLQICFGLSFWLHALVFPLNPKTLSQPTPLTYVGAICEILVPGLLLMAAVFLLRAVLTFAANRKRK
ncbi:MAG TPA: hypothetical protein VLT36_03150 [Candidatus Dormibacteraeota bacterium]|nr:hypothetical protein [Candidatus Dormibacteraeota bacterium]